MKKSRFADGYEPYEEIEYGLVKFYNDGVVLALGICECSPILSTDEFLVCKALNCP